MPRRFLKIFSCFVFFLILPLAIPLPLEASSPDLKSLKNKADHLLVQEQILPALDLYQKVIAENPAFANCHYNMAICYHELGEFNQAYACLEKFIEFKPTDSEAFFNMGILKIYLGEDAKARELLLKARTLRPSKEIENKIKNALDHLVDSPFPSQSITEITAYLSKPSSSSS